MTASTSHLIPPHGGELINLIAATNRIGELKAHSKEWPSWDLTARQLCDLELLITGGFSPLQGFMTRVETMKASATTCGWPVGYFGRCQSRSTLPEEFAKKLTAGSSKIALRDPEGVMLAVLHVEDVWQPDRKAEAKAVFASTSAAHPGADYAINKANPWYVGGKIEGYANPLPLRFSQPALDSSRSCARNLPARAGAA